MKVSACVTLGSGAQTLDRAIALEDADLDVIGVAEAYGIDAVSMLGYRAARTTRVELMSQILPIYARTPTLTAMTAAGLDFVSGGRFLLGLGASGPRGSGVTRSPAAWPSATSRSARCSSRLAVRSQSATT